MHVGKAIFFYGKKLQFCHRMYRMFVIFSRYLGVPNVRRAENLVCCQSVTNFLFTLEEETRAEPLNTETASLTEKVEEEEVATGQLSNSKTKIEATSDIANSISMALARLVG